jgi:predicted RNA binding protein YcfA (HicA-like mRNA interferase family)
MSRLPGVKPEEAIRCLQKLGFEIVRVRGSHYQLHNPTTKKRATVVHHTRDLTKATLSSIIRQTGLTAEEFLALL